MKTPYSLPQFVGCDSTKLSRNSRNYWCKLQRTLAGQVEGIDPHRIPLRELRRNFRGIGRVYRASTGGKWGKSSRIVII